MNSMPAAMIWEMFSRGRWTLICGFLGANLLPAIVFGVLRLEGVVVTGDAELQGMHASLILVNVFIFATAVFGAQGAPSRLYAYPIPTSTLAACHLVVAMVIVAIEMLLSTVLMNAVFQLNWPLWGPALFAAAMVGAAQATIWYTEKSAWMPVAVAAATIVLGGWYMLHYAPSIRSSAAGWPEVAPFEVVLLFLVMIGSYFLSVAGIQRNRCGEPLGSPAIIFWLMQVLDFDPVLAPSFRTPSEAQFWFEWQKKGWAMPGIVAFLTILGICSWGLFVRDPKELIQSFIAGGLLMSVLGIICGLIIGNLGHSDTSCDIGHFRASRPLTNVTMAKILLQVVAKSVLSAWLIWFVSLLFCCGLLWACGVQLESVFPARFHWWYFPLTLLSAWTVVAVVASMIMTARVKELFQVFCALFAIYLLLVVYAKYALTPLGQQQLFEAAAVICSVALILASAALITAARRRQLIGWPTLSLSIVGWVVLAALIMSEWMHHPLSTFGVYFFGLGVAALSVVPFSAAPLAVSWNRNR